MITTIKLCTNDLKRGYIHNHWKANVYDDGVGVITGNMKFHRDLRTDSAVRYLGPRSSHPEEATDVVDARRARSEVGGPR